MALICPLLHIRLLQPCRGNFIRFHAFSLPHCDGRMGDSLELGSLADLLSTPTTSLVRNRCSPFYGFTSRVLLAQDITNGN